jgi:hypothetical protein
MIYNILKLFKDIIYLYRIRLLVIRLIVKRETAQNKYEINLN